MQVNITFRHLEPTEALKSHVKGRVEHVQRYIDRPSEAHAVLHVENFDHHAEITVKAGRFLLRGTARSPDINASTILRRVGSARVWKTSLCIIMHMHNCA